MDILKRTGKRMLALLLSMMLALSIPVYPATRASAEEGGDNGQPEEVSWVQPYLDKMVGWNIVRGDGSGNMNTEGDITRAEFVAMMNRAYGYTDMGPVPFEDISPDDWFYEDICKAYNAGILHGTSPTTVSPYDPISREQAITLIARNMRMDEVPGEVIDFSDGREFSSFSRGYVKAAVLAGIIDGYTDGTCKPLNNVTRGEAMKMLCVGIGSLISEPGTHAPGSVFGNLTINSTNVTLKDSIITGDLYISGGISLGDVVLENVQVQGRIVVAGGGSSELGQNSVLLRGVDTDKIIVDAPTGQFVSVRSEGRTHIQEGIFRSNAFFEDGCRDQYGILNVSLEASQGANFTLAGNLENIVNRTPGSVLTFGDAQASNVTVDERAVGSRLVFEINSSADEVNLDVGTAVEGTGDIGHLTINSAGSSTTMLPDTITIRPGLNANISGDDMDASEADEFSEEPRLLNGYPKVANIAPTSADGITSSNKKGTVYWGLTSAVMGAVPDTAEGQERLISPSYGAGFLLSGSYPSETSNTDFTIPERLTNLTSSGTYFVSAVLVDVRGHRSPVYSERFETPDDIIPAFSSNEYPKMTQVETDESYVTVMANKDCVLYYALLPQGSTPPTQNEFLSFAFTDPLGCGQVTLKKNKSDTVQVNRIIYPDYMNQADKVTPLQEQVTYDLYLWLADADGIKSSAITKLSFTTRDKTPPVFVTDMQQTTMGATNIGANAVINEAGTIYWAIVETGTEYPVPKRGSGDKSTDEAFLRTDYAKAQVQYAQNALKGGNVRATANNNAAINITGLKAETAYDLYYIAVDSAQPGNYSEIVKRLTVYTEDNTPPTAQVTFSRTAPGTEGQPYADSDVRIEFSENIMYGPTSLVPLDLYETIKSSSSTESQKQQAEKELFTNILPKIIKLYQVNGGNASDVSGSSLDYTKATLELDRSGKLIVTFPGGEGIHLESGATYYFEFSPDITDASPKKNHMRDPLLSTRFTTVSSLARLDKDVVATHIAASDTDALTDDNIIDMSFSLTPDSTASSTAGLRWDMKLWFDTPVEFDIYRRVRRDDPTSNTGWTKLNGSTVSITAIPENDFRGTELTTIRGTNVAWNIYDKTLANQLDTVTGSNDNLMEGLTYEYALHFTKVASQEDRKDFTNLVTCKLHVLAGSNSNLDMVTSQLSIANMEDKIKELGGEVRDITSPTGFEVNKQFVDGNAPKFNPGLPSFDADDSGATMHLALNRTGTVYYVIAPAANLYPTKSNVRIDLENPSGNVDEDNTLVPENGNGYQPGITPGGNNSPNTPSGMTWPAVSDIMNPRGNYLITSNTNAIYGTIPNVSGNVHDIPVTGLQPTTMYYAYFVVEGGSNMVSQVYVYRFTTTEIVRPEITLIRDGSNVRVSSSHTGVVNYIVLPFTTEALESCKIHYYSPDDIKEDPEHKEKNVWFESALSPISEKAYEALSQDAKSGQDGGKGSEYDRTATSEHKLFLAQQIRSSASGSGQVVGSGTLNVTAGQQYTVDCSQMELAPDSSYIFLAVGKSATGSADAFRATYPVMLVDKTPPAVVSISNALRVTAKGFLSGELTLNFSENIYYKDLASGTLVDPVKFCFHKSASRPTDTTADPINICSSSHISVVKSNEAHSGTDPDCTQITLSYNNAIRTESVTLNRVITDKAGNRIGTITISTTVDKNNNVQVQVNRQPF